MQMKVKRPVGRPREGKVYVNFNRRMELWMDEDIRLIVGLMPEKYKNMSQFIDLALKEKIKADKLELYIRGLIEIPE